MIIPLSKGGSDELVLEWSGEITDDHEHEFCDIGHRNIDYIHRQYQENVYGKSFIVMIRQNGKPVATCGAWRCDIDGVPAFQLGNLLTLPSVRKNGYMLDMLYGIFDAAKTVSQNAVIYGMPNRGSYPIYKALGFAGKKLYIHIYFGPSKEFIESMPLIQNEYILGLYQNNSEAYVRKIKGESYLIRRYNYRLPRKFMYKNSITVGEILGRISSTWAQKFRKSSIFLPLCYYSYNPGFMGDKSISHTIAYTLNPSMDAAQFLRPRYMKYARVFLRNGNKH